MPSSATSRGRFEKQGSGENSNTWGSKLNTSALDLLDEAINGVETIAATGGVTLTTTNYVSDQQRNVAWNFTGTGSNTVTIPATEQVKLVRNATNGTLTVSNGSNSVTIAIGQVAWILSDGTNVWKETASDAAAASAAAAAASQAAAGASATNAAASATTASGHASMASTQASNASSSASAAATSASNAATSATNAANSATAAANSVSNIPAANVQFIIDGGGAAITTGVKGDLVLPFAGTIIAWDLLADQSGSITVNVWKDSYANFPPVTGDVIVSPAISSSNKAQATGLALSFATGDILRFNVASASTVGRVTLALKITRS